MLVAGQTDNPTLGRAERDYAVLSEQDKWEAVLARNGHLDGRFVFCVRSTGIYCRPSCPARRPAKEQVVFFPGSVEAEQSGFRPCHRCLPRQVESPRTKLIEQACEYIEANLQGKLTLKILSSQAGLSPYHFQRTFKSVLGISPREYISSRRLARMKENLKRGVTVNESLFDAGFSSRSRVYENALDGFGMNPGEFRRGGEGLQIQYGIADSPIGRVLVATTERGICGVCIGDSDDLLEGSLSDDFPAATLIRNNDGVKELTQAFERYFDGDYSALNLPVDVRATAFQSRVWKAIQSIPWGKTATYSQIAEELGKPNGSRAVARACATNPVALVIPCHRVIGKDGDLRGYRWGMPRKKGLLDLEKRTKQRSPIPQPVRDGLAQISNLSG